MDGIPSPINASVAQSYNDLNSLNSITALGKKDKSAAIDQVAKQFESFFVREMMKSMRAATNVFAKDNPLNSNEMEFRQDMLDQQLSVSLTEGRGMGLADILARQLKAQAGITPSQSNTTTGGNMAQELRRFSGDVQKSAQSLMDSASELIDDALEFVQPVTQKLEQAIANMPVNFNSKEEFVASVMPYAKAAAEKLGVDPKVLVAQSALETGWGKHMIAGSNNLFNIKAGKQWNGGAVGVDTLEYKDGVAKKERASFRAYESIAESFNDLVDLLSSKPRYQQALANADDPHQFVRELQDAGYATDPEYANKIIRVMGDVSDITPAS